MTDTVFTITSASVFSWLQKNTSFKEFQHHATGSWPNYDGDRKLLEVCLSD
jgi:hypothetical protein